MSLINALALINIKRLINVIHQMTFIGVFDVLAIRTSKTLINLIELINFN